MLAVWPLSAFRGYFVQIAVLWGRAGCPLSGVERYPLLGGSKCTISMGRAIGGMKFVRRTEVVRLSESPLLEVSLYKLVTHNRLVWGCGGGYWTNVVRYHYQHSNV